MFLHILAFLAMDPNNRLGKMLAKEDNNQCGWIDESIESESEWNRNDTWDTTDSGKKNGVKSFTFFRLESEDDIFGKVHHTVLCGTA